LIEILDGTTKNPITKIGSRAGICYGANVENQESNYNRGLDCLKSNHGRTLEVVDVELIISGYSARVIREWYTHIGGDPTRLQSSTRYINYENFDYYTPESIKNHPEALRDYKYIMHQISGLLKELDELNIPKEDSANALPMGYITKMYDKRNLRNLIDMSHQRLCTRAYKEYRDLMSELMTALSNYSDEWKYIVENYFKPKCFVTGYCSEKKSCGKKPRLI
jgi:thymidylate synthase (FAD)